LGVQGIEEKPVGEHGKTDLQKKEEGVNIDLLIHSKERGTIEKSRETRSWELNGC